MPDKNKRKHNLKNTLNWKIHQQVTTTLKRVNTKNNNKNETFWIVYVKDTG